MALFGYDISSAQAGLDVKVVPSDFVAVKATGGVDYINPYCDGWVQDAWAVGKQVLVYHYVHEAASRGTATQEADWFLNNTRGYWGKAILCVDWESDNVTDSAYALEFKHRVEAVSGCRLTGYGSVSQLNYLRPIYDEDSPIWAAAYTLGNQPINGYNLPVGPIGLPDGFNISMWQFTSSGYLPGWGSNLDLNVFYGDVAAWQKLAAPIGAVLPDSGPAPVPLPTPAPAPAPDPAPAPAPAPVVIGPGPGQCSVDPGDTMTSIAAQYNISLWDLEKANPGINFDLIWPGQILNVPGLGAGPSGNYCTVDPGDNMSSIAAQFNISLEQLEACNPGINYDLIFPGQRLNLP